MALQDLSVEGLKKFLEEKSVPLVTEMNKDPASHSFLLKFFNAVATKVLCFCIELVSCSDDKAYL
jgi:hypothetical protein